MPNIFGEKDETMVIGRGYGGYGGGYGGEGNGLGGIGAIIALVVVVAILWFLAREGKNCNDGGYNNMPYPYPAYPYPPYGGGGNCCSPLDCKIPMAPDMSNCEVDKDLWKVDADVWKSACETQKVVTTGDQAILNKLCETETQNLRDKLAKEYAKNSACETREFTQALFGQLKDKMACYDNQVDKQFCNVNAKFDKLFCELPMRPPVWCEGITPNTHHTDCHDFPRRSRGDKDCDCNCGW